MKAARVALWAVLPAELALFIALLVDIEVPFAILLVAEALLITVLLGETALFARLYLIHRRTAPSRRAAFVGAVRTLVPVTLRRLLAHELNVLYSLSLWLSRRRHGVAQAVYTAAYTGPQTAMMWGLISVSAVETVALAVLIPWPLIHAITLVIDVYGLVLMIGLHAACVTRPHTVGADGALRIRYGALFDLRIPASLIGRVRVERRYPTGSLVQQRDDGVLELIVGGMTAVVVELVAPVVFVRPLGKRGEARTIRFHADDPQALITAIEQTRPHRTEPAPGR